LTYTTGSLMLFPFWYDTVSDKPLPSIRYRPGTTQAGMAHYCKRP
jgi:hypothetical protein